MPKRRHGRNLAELSFVARLLLLTAWINAAGIQPVNAASGVNYD